MAQGGYRAGPGDSRADSDPLTLTLIRDTYQASDDVSELLDAGSRGTAEDLEKRLIARVLPNAYNPAPGRPTPRYSLPQATQALTFIARQMKHDHTRDLAWWQVPRWTPTIPRILASILAAGLIGGLLGGLMFGLAGGLATGVAHGLALVPNGLAFGFGVGLPFGLRFGHGGHEPRRVKTWRAIRIGSIVAAGLLYGPVVGFVVLLVTAAMNRLGGQIVAFRVLEFVTGLAFGLMFVLMFVLKQDFVGRLADGKENPQGPRERGRNHRVVGLAVGLMGGLALGLVLGLVSGLILGFVVGLAGWSAARLAGGLSGGLVEGKRGPQSPRESWRNDRVVGLVVGLAGGQTFTPCTELGVRVCLGRATVGDKGVSVPV